MSRRRRSRRRRNLFRAERRFKTIQPSWLSLNGRYKFDKIMRRPLTFYYIIIRGSVIVLNAVFIFPFFFFFSFCAAIAFLHLYCNAIFPVASRQQRRYLFCSRLICLHKLWNAFIGDRPSGFLRARHSFYNQMCPRVYKIKNKIWHCLQLWPIRTAYDEPCVKFSRLYTWTKKNYGHIVRNIKKPLEQFRKL